jgi:hypothetical protein
MFAGYGHALGQAPGRLRLGCALAMQAPCPPVHAGGFFFEPLLGSLDKSSKRRDIPHPARFPQENPARPSGVFAFS